MWVSNPEKVGKDAGELAGLGRELGVLATDDKEALYALEPDCIVHTAMVDDRIFEAIADLTEMLERGINVVSSGPVLLCYPQGLGLDEFVDAIDAAGQKTGASLHVNGIDPGWANDVLPLALTSLSQRIDLVRVSEIADYSTYYQPVVMNEIYGFGKPMDHVAMLWQPGILTTAWGPVVRQIAAGLEVELDPELEEIVEREPADRDLSTASVDIAEGTMGAVRFQVVGKVDGVPRVILDHVTRTHVDQMPLVAAAARGGRLLPRRGRGRAGDAHRLHPPRRGRRPQRVRDDRHRDAPGELRACRLRSRAGARVRQGPAAGHRPRVGSVRDVTPPSDGQRVVDRAGRGEWTEPGAFEVAPGVHRLPLPLPMDGLRAVNVYVIETDDGLVLIDGGWAIPESRKVFDASLKQLGYSVRDIRRFLVTHMHRDHYTQASVVGREVGAHVSLGIGDKATMDLMHSDVLNEDPNMDRLRAAGAEGLAEGWRAMMPEGRPPMDDYGMPDEWLDRDLVIDLGPRRLGAVSTPGHTQGHYVFADEEASLLFAGDHVLSTITPSIGFEPAYVQQPLRDYLASLAKVRALPDLKLLPAHGPVTRVLAHACRRARRSPRRAARPVAARRRVRCAYGVGGRRRAARGPGASATVTTSARSTECSRRSRRSPTSSCSASRARWPGSTAPTVRFEPLPHI